MVASAGTDGIALLKLDAVDNTNGRMVASAGSGAAAQILLVGGVVSGGVLQTVGAGAAISVFPAQSATISGAAIAANSNIILGQNALGVQPVALTLDSDTFGAGTVLEATEGSTVSINGGLTLSAGALIEALDDSTVAITGNVANAGTIIEDESKGLRSVVPTTLSISGGNISNTGTIAYLLNALGSPSAAHNSRLARPAPSSNSGTVEIGGERTRRSDR